MKNYIIAGLVCAVAALSFGIESIQKIVNEAANHGRLKGVDRCLAYTNSELLSPDAVRSSCVATFQKRYFVVGMAGGKAGPRPEREGASWSGSLDNETSNYVTTWIEITVSVFDQAGEETTFVADTSVWIDPMDTVDFAVQLVDATWDDFENTEFCDLEASERTNCMAWTISDLMGLAI